MNILFLFSALASAQVVVPARAPVLPVPVGPSIILPAPVITPVLPRPADVPVVPVPVLPGVPMYRLSSPVGRLQDLGGGTRPGSPAVAVALAKVADDKAAEVRPAAPVKAVERARRSFGLSGKRPDARRLQALFDGSSLDDLDGVIAIVEEIERPQTLPEQDLLREIGATAPRR